MDFLAAPRRVRVAVPTELAEPRGPGLMFRVLPRAATRLQRPGLYTSKEIAR